MIERVGVRLARVLFLFAGVTLAALTQPALAASLTVLVDLDNNPATGCTVATPSGSFTGVEQRIVTTVDTTVLPPKVTQVTQETCVTPATNTFGAPVVISSGGWNVGVGNGTAGANVIESSFPIPASAKQVRLGFIYSDPAIGADGLIAQVSGAAIVVAAAAGSPGPIGIPMLSQAMLALLAALVIGVAFLALRRSGVALGPLAVVLLLLFSSIPWAAIVVDGLTGDWTSIGPIATDPQGDAPAGSDIAAAFATIEGTTLFVRADVKTGLVPLAVADSYTVLAGTTLTVPAATGLTANDSLGVPAGTVTFYGGSSIGGTVTSHAAGTTTTFGVGGSVTVNADGSFAFTPATGFTGTFIFNYRLANLNGTSDATVSITAQQAPAITSGASATLTVGTPGGFNVVTSGTPPPVLTMSGVLPAGVTFSVSCTTICVGSLGGIPAAGTGGIYPLTFTAINSVGTATQNFTLKVSQAPAITSANNATFVTGNAGTFTVMATGFPAPTFSVTGALPSGVTLNPATGVLSGTPGAGTAGTYPLTLTASNGVGANATQSFTLTVT